jgi:hypothetical protein
VREADSFADPTRLYTEAAVIKGVSEAVSNKHENGALRNARFALLRMYFNSQGSLLSARFTGLLAADWHNLYYHFMLKRRFSLPVVALHH